MKLHDYSDKVVLITGGTKGIGLAAALAFARRGAHVWLTHRWGSADEDQIRRRFAELGARSLNIREADVSRDADAKALFEEIAKAHDGIDVFISNVCVVLRGDGVQAHRERSLLKSLDYSAWPFVGYMQLIHKRFGRWPSYAVATSSDGADRHFPYYDYVAVAKSVLETFARYLATHLRAENCRVNVLRTRQVVTDSYAQVFGADNVALAGEFSDFEISLDECGNAIYALCSGLLDAMSGQVVTVDRGAGFVDNVMTMGPRLLTRAGQLVGDPLGEGPDASPDDQPGKPSQSPTEPGR